MKTSFLSILTAIFVTLKLTGHIEWSWWWVLSPLIFQAAIVVLVIVAAVWAAYLKAKCR